MKILPVVILAFLLAASPAVSQVADDKLIVPGERIGPHRLGAPYGFFDAAWGENNLGGREQRYCPGIRTAWTVKPMGYNAFFWQDVAIWVGISLIS